MGRQAVIDALIVRLATITVANGYQTGIGANVNSFYELVIERDELPFVNVREKGSDVPQIAGEWLHACPVEIAIIVNVTADTMEYIRKAANDVLAVIKADKTITGTCVDVTLDSVDFDLREEETQYAGAVVNLTVSYITDEWEV